MLGAKKWKFNHLVSVIYFFCTIIFLRLNFKKLITFLDLFCNRIFSLFLGSLIYGLDVYWCWYLNNYVEIMYFIRPTIWKSSFCVDNVIKVSKSEIFKMFLARGCENLPVLIFRIARRGCYCAIIERLFLWCNYDYR